MIKNISVVLLAAALASCSLLKADAKVMSGAFVACAKADLAAEVANLPSQVISDIELGGATLIEGLLSDVSALIAADLPSLEADLTSIAAQVGLDAVDCAIAAVDAVMKGTGSGSGSASTTAMPRLMTASAAHGVARAKAWSVNAHKMAHK
jgi:hypothetical protein